MNRRLTMDTQTVDLHQEQDINSMDRTDMQAVAQVASNTSLLQMASQEEDLVHQDQDQDGTAVLKDNQALVMGTMRMEDTINTSSSTSHHHLHKSLLLLRENQPPLHHDRLESPLLLHHRRPENQLLHHLENLLLLRRHRLDSQVLSRRRLALSHTLLDQKQTLQNAQHRVLVPTAMHRRAGRRPRKRPKSAKKSEGERKRPGESKKRKRNNELRLNAKLGLKQRRRNGKRCGHAKRSNASEKLGSGWQENV